MRKGALRGRPGFTMTELMVALFLSSVGMVTVFGVQVAANVVQRHGRDINAARLLGESFITRLRGETVNWTTVGEDTTLDGLVNQYADFTQADTPLLWWALSSPASLTRRGTIPTPPAPLNEGDKIVWMAVPNVALNSSPTHNALGIPDDSSDPRVVSTPTRLMRHNQRYCINYNLTQVGDEVATGEMLRAQVRVYWPIRDDAFASGYGVPDCGFADPDAMQTATDDGFFRYVQLNSVLYRHEDML